MPNYKKTSEYLDWREIIDARIITRAQASELETMLHQYMSAKAMESEAKEVLGDSKHPALAKLLEAKLLDLGLPKMTYLGNRFRVQSGESQTIKKELLVANGVSLEVIEASIQKTPWSTIIMDAENSGFPESAKVRK